MLFSSLSLTLLIASFCGSAAAINCAICPPSIVYAGLTRKLTLTRYSASAGTAQCNFDSPPISGFSPYCVFRNFDGQVTATNTGATITSLPGACPSIATVVSKTSCTA